MSDDELIKHCACLDGEATPAEQADASRSSDDPIVRQLFQEFTKLNVAARNESAPLNDVAPDELWALIADRFIPVSNDIALTLAKCAKDETVPVVPAERFSMILHDIQLHKSAGHEKGPSIEHDRWHGVWHKISTRTTRDKIVQLPTAQSPVAPPPVAAPSADFKKREGRYFAPWVWAAVAGLAASVLIASALPQAPAVMSVSSAKNRTINTLVAPDLSMNIPEVQDENYGVRVRFVPGNSDPVVSLYLKTPSRATSIDGSDFEDRP